MIGLLYTRPKNDTQARAPTALKCILLGWDFVSGIVLLMQGIQGCHKSSGKILLCIHLSAREYIFCLLAAHPSYRQSSHFAYTQQSLRGGRTMCPMSDAGFLRLHTNTGVHPNFVKSNQDVNAFHESFNETNNKGLSVVRLFLPSRSLEPSGQVACGGEIRWNLTC